MFQRPKHALAHAHCLFTKQLYNLLTSTSRCYTTACTFSAFSPTQVCTYVVCLEWNLTLMTDRWYPCPA